MGGTGRVLLVAALLLAVLAAGCADRKQAASEELEAQAIPATDTPLAAAVGGEPMLTAACPTDGDVLASVAWTIRSPTHAQIDRGPLSLDEHGQASLAVSLDVAGEHRVEARCLLDGEPILEPLSWTIAASEQRSADRIAEPLVPDEVAGSEGWPTDPGKRHGESRATSSPGHAEAEDRSPEPSRSEADREATSERDPSGPDEDRYRDGPSKVPADRGDDDGRAASEDPEGSGEKEDGAGDEQDNGADFHGPQGDAEVGLFGGGGGGYGDDSGGDEAGTDGEPSTVPTDDTTVRSVEPNATAGDEGRLASGNASNATSHTLLRFDLAHLAQPAANESVCLTLHSLTDDASPHPIALRPYDDASWSEADLAWSDLSPSAIADPIATREIAGEGNVSWNVTDHVQDRGDEAIALLLSLEDERSEPQQWSAKEADEPPLLALHANGCSASETDAGDEQDPPPPSDPGPETIATDDTTLRSGSPNATSGSNATLVSANTSNARSHALLRFDLARLAQPAANESVCLTVHSLTDDPAPHRIALRPYDDTNWTESNLTWANRSTAAMGEPIEVHDVRGAGNSTWNLTDHLAEKGQTAAVAFLLTLEDETSQAQRWSAKEADEPPLLALHATGCSASETDAGDEQDPPPPSDPGPETIATDDTTVASNRPDRSHGEADRLSSANGTPGVHHAVVKFDLANLTAPEGDAVCLTIRSHPDNGARSASIGLRPYHDTAWSEGNLTWSNRSPAAVGDPIDVREVRGEGNTTWNVTDHVPENASTDELAFLLSNEDEDGEAHLWQAKEGGQAPRLSLAEEGCQGEPPADDEPRLPELPLASGLATDRWTQRKPGGEPNASLR